MLFSSIFLEYVIFFFFSSRRRHTRFDCDWSSDVCSSDLTGGTPGGITGAFSERESGTTGIVLMNNTGAKDPAGTAIRLGHHVVANDPAALEPWTAGTAAPAELLPLVGVWFSEGAPFVFRIRAGRLEAVAGGLDSTAAPSVFRPDGD